MSSQEVTVDQQNSAEVNILHKNKPESLLKIGVIKFLKNKLSLLGGIAIIIIIAMAVFAPWLAPYDPATQDLINTLAPPSMDHFLGTDELGRDTFSRLLYGARVSLLVSFTAVAGMKTIGVVIGATAGYFGGIVDSVLMRFVDVIISFPQIFLLITMLAVLEPGLKTLIIVFVLFSWTGTARLVRGEYLSLRSREFVLASRTMGIKTSKVMFKHILPNAMGPIIVSATLSVGGVILSEAGLSFLGLGIQPPTPSWGNMLQAAQDFDIMMNAWWYPIFPGVMILITVLAFNFVGDGLRDAFDPRDK